MKVECPQCGAGYQVRDDHAGKRFNCKKCHQTISIPAAAIEQEIVADSDQSTDAASRINIETDDRPVKAKGGQIRIPASHRNLIHGKLKEANITLSRDEMLIEGGWLDAPLSIPRDTAGPRMKLVFATNENLPRGKTVDGTTLKIGRKLFVISDEFRPVLKAWIPGTHLPINATNKGIMVSWGTIVLGIVGLVVLFMDNPPNPLGSGRGIVLPTIGFLSFISTGAINLLLAKKFRKRSAKLAKLRGDSDPFLSYLSK